MNLCRCGCGTAIPDLTAAGKPRRFVFGHHKRGNGRVVSSHGYPKTTVGIGHPLADPNGYAYEHLVVWVSAGNPRPETDEILHHRNGDKTDNRIENLELLTRAEHNQHHNAERGRDEHGRFRPRELPR